MSQLNGNLTLIAQCVGHVNDRAIMHFNGYINAREVSAIHVREKRLDGSQDFTEGESYIVRLTDIEVNKDVLTTSYAKMRKV